MEEGMIQLLKIIKIKGRLDKYKKILVTKRIKEIWNLSS